MVIKWFKNNWVLVLVLLIGAFFRLYRIDNYMTFLGDEGRDVIIVRNLLVHADPILIGPGTSVGGMYLGPLYYYFMAPFLFLSNFSPVGPAIGVALLGIVTIYLVYVVGRDWFGKIAGLIASALYAISPTVIIYSRSSWNPNIMPFFALLSIYSIWKVYAKHEYNWLIVCVISFAFVLQSHYLGIFLAPVLFTYWIIAKVPKRITLISMLVFSFLMSPLLIFDIRHDWMNSRALYKFLTAREEVLSINPLNSMLGTYPLFEQITGSMITAKNEMFGRILSLSIILFLILIPFRNKKIIILWLFLGIIGLSLYKQNIYDHYFGFLFPVVFLILGVMISKMYQSKYKILSLIIIGFLIFINFKYNSLKRSPNNQLQRSMAVSQKIIEESKNERFNLAVIAETNYEDGYQYFLEKENSKIVEIDSQIEESITDQLFVICEVNGSTLTENACNPVNSPKAQVANFGWSKIEDMWTVDGVIIYKLVHNYSEEK